MSNSAQLREDHRTLDQALADLSTRANKGDWKEFDALWDGLVKDLEHHLRYEERELLRPFGARDRDSQTIADELRSDHREIRRRCEDLGLQLQLRQIRATTIDAFVDLLRSHAAREEKTLYVWADSRAA